MSKLYIIQGFLGAGKTTYSQALAQKLQITRLNADEWCEKNFPPEKLHNDWNACFSEAIKILWAEAERLLQNKQSVILDFGFWSKDSRNHAREIARRLNVPCELHYIYAPDHVLLARLGKRSGPIAENNIKATSKNPIFFEFIRVSERNVVDCGVFCCGFSGF